MGRLFLSWYDKNYLDLNVSKTKERLIDFKRNINSCGQHHSLEKCGKGSCIYLGTYFDENLKFNVNTADVVKGGDKEFISHVN